MGTTAGNILDAHPALNGPVRERDLDATSRLDSCVAIIEATMYSGNPAVIEKLDEIEANMVVVMPRAGGGASAVGHSRSVRSAAAPAAATAIPVPTAAPGSEDAGLGPGTSSATLAAPATVGSLLAFIDGASKGTHDLTKYSTQRSSSSGLRTL